MPAERAEEAQQRIDAAELLQHDARGGHAAAGLYTRFDVGGDCRDLDALVQVIRGRLAGG